MMKKIIYSIAILIILLTPIMDVDAGWDGEVNPGANCSPPCVTTSGDTTGEYKSIYKINIPGVGLRTAKVVESGCTIIGSTCSPQYGIYGMKQGADWQIYDMYNNSILDGNNFTDSVIAGTYFGANLYEYRTYTWWAAGTEVTTLQCEVVYHYLKCAIHCNDKTGYCFSECWNEPYIYTYYTNGSAWSESCQATANRLAYEYAKSELEKKGSSYTASITDPNDVRCNYPEKYADELAKENITCNNYDVKSTSSSVTTYEESLKNGGKVTKYYYYEMYGACINVKTSDVRYINEDEKCTTDEYFVENDYVDDLSKKHWHLFTPINTKESEGYTLTFKSDTKTVMDGGICQNLVEKYAENFEYALYIKPTTGSFTYNIETDKKKVVNGCYTELVLNIPTVQKYYGEEITENSDTLKGFNFYYRLIDIDNPFPNGINDDSYWKEWQDSGKKDPDIEDSFNEITYWTSGIDLNEIRDYNYLNTYLDWETMNVNGLSSFITTKELLNRKSTITQSKVYSLGCAPTNMCEYYINSDGLRTENPLYQPECKDTRDGVSCP